jgi:hypothetical protein
MTKLKGIIFYLIFLNINLCSFAQVLPQNFITNGSFDSIVSADFLTYFSLSQHDNRWIQYPTGASFMHLNSIPITIPNVFYGYQLPQKGNGMYSMSFIGNTNLGCWESQSYIQIKLFRKLRDNKLYKGKFYASLVDTCTLATSRIGMYISTSAPALTYLQPNQSNPYISAAPQIQQPHLQAITDKINWSKIEGIFRASANMQYMTLGNFYRANQTDTVRVFNISNPISCFNEGAAYFLDNLSLVEEDRAEAYKDTTKNYLCVKQGTSKVLGDTAVRPWLKYTWRNKNNSIVGTNRNYTYNATLIENTFFTVEIKDTGEYAFITKAVDTIFIYTSVSADTVNCQPVGFNDVLADAEKIEMFYVENQIKFNELHERFTGCILQLKSIDGRTIFKTDLKRKQNEYSINRVLQKGFYYVDIIYNQVSIRRKKIIID